MSMATGGPVSMQGFTGFFRAAVSASFRLKVVGMEAWGRRREVLAEERRGGCSCWRRKMTMMMTKSNAVVDLDRDCCAIFSLRSFVWTVSTVNIYIYVCRPIS